MARGKAASAKRKSGLDLTSWASGNAARDTTQSAASAAKLAPGTEQRTLFGGEGASRADADIEERLTKAAADYRSQNFKTGERVWWNKPGAAEVIGIAQAGAKAGISKLALAKAAGVTFATMSKWIEESATENHAGQPRRAATAERTATAMLTTASERPGMVTFDIEKLSGGGYRVSIEPRHIKTFLQSI